MDGSSAPFERVLVPLVVVAVRVGRTSAMAPATRSPRTGREQEVRYPPEACVPSPHEPYLREQVSAWPATAAPRTSAGWHGPTTPRRLRREHEG